MVSRRRFLGMVAGASLGGCGGQAAPPSGAPLTADIPTPRDDTGSSTSHASPRAKVGVILPLSGPNAVFGDAAQKGIELARDELHASGTVTLDLVIEDDRSSPNAAADRVGKLIDRDGVVALLGEIASGVSKPCAIVATNRKVPLLTPASTDRSVTEIGPYAFRACFIDEMQGLFAARYIVSVLGKKNVGLAMASDNHYSQVLSDAFKRALAEVGGTLVVETSVSGRQTDFGPAVAALKAKRPEIVFAPLYFTQMIPLAKRAATDGITAETFFGCDGWTGDPGLLALEGARFIDHWSEDVPYPRSKAFVEAFKKRYAASPDSVAALSYDATCILGDAVTRATDRTPEAIRDALAATRDFDGSSGRISMDPERNPTKPGCVLAIRNGGIVFEAAVEPTRQ